MCLWLNDGTSPVIGMSLRFDRIDNFWFVLRHELEHVIQDTVKLSQNRYRYSPYESEDEDEKIAMRLRYYAISEQK
jgi:HTH-type transcriptional regulator/antitoxin HigA